MKSEDVGQLFRSAKRFIFRLEALDRYNVSAEDEDHQRWSRGEPPPPIDGDWWFDDVVRTITSSGRRWERVHMLRLPLTDYLRFELEFGYTRSEQAGERCHILELGEGQPTPVPPVDFWLFDDDVVLRMDYDAEGRVVDRVPIISPDRVREFVCRRDLALSLATPFPVWFSHARELGAI